MRAAFLLGSGISKPSKAPMVEEITNRIINGSWHSHTDETFIPGAWENPYIPNDLAERAQELIRCLHRRIENHIHRYSGRPPHYEDYFSCLWQIVQDETFEVPNPLLENFVSAFKAETVHLYEGQTSHIGIVTETGLTQNRFASLAERTSRLIQWAVYYSLIGAKDPVGLNLISEAARDFGSLDIFSLNHDLLLEKYLDGEDIKYADGFSEMDGDVQLFNSSWRGFGGPVCLFKLHGSIDWWRLRFKSRSVDQFAKVVGNPEDAKDSTGARLWSLDNIPKFLTGTTSKEQAYGSDLFVDVFAEFRQRLNGYRTLICSGYGWEDKGINIRIDQWLRNDRANRVVILHGKEGESLEQKRFWSNR